MAIDMAQPKMHKKLADIKEKVRDSYTFFSDTYSKYNEYRRFSLVHTLSDQDVSMLEAMGFPSTEFNIIEPYITALSGEMVEQDPAVSVESDDEAQVNPEVNELVEQHLRHTLCSPDTIPIKKQVIEEQLSGGRSIIKIATDYAGHKTFKQIIKFEKANPELCGFDPMAETAHKGDGEYCFECFPMLIAEFKELYKEVNIESFRFMRSEEGFSWSYKSGKEKYVVPCDFYVKKKKHAWIVELADGQVMEEKEYKAELEKWGVFSQLPQVVDKRKSKMEKIMRYRVIESKILEIEETPFSILPLIHVDGNSARIRSGDNGAVEEIIRPFFYNAIGAQRLKNLAGNVAANSLQGIVNHKFMVAKEALPKEEEYLSAYKDVQNASTLVYNAFYENNPNQAIPNPIMPIPKMPAPPEVLQTFMAADSLMQNTMGSYDSSVGRANNNQLSGIAMVQSQLSSTKAAMTYVQNYMLAIQRWAQEYVNLMPKFFVTPRTLPVMDKEGQKSYVKINKNPQQPDLMWDENALNIRVEAGANFKVQKQVALNQIIELSRANQAVGQFFSTKGLPMIFDNMTMRGADEMKEAAKEWMAEQAQLAKQQQQMQQQQIENNPIVMRNKIDMAELEAKKQEHAQQAQIDREKMALERQKLASQIMLETKKNQVKLAELKVKGDHEKHQMKHDHFMGMAKLHHEVHMPVERKGASA